MEMKNICSKKEYNANGEKKVKWFQIGTLNTNNDGKQFVNLNMFPNESFYVFENKKEKQTEKEGWE